MEEMAKIPGLTRRGNVFYLRKRVPEDIRQSIAGDFSVWQRLAMNPGSKLHSWKTLAPDRHTIRPFFEKSLKTKELGEARIAFHDLSARLEDAFQIVRAAYAGKGRIATDNDLRRIAGEYFASADRQSDREVSELIASGTGLEDARWSAIEDLGGLDPNDPVVAGRLQSKAKSLAAGAEFSINVEQTRTLAGYLLRAERLLLTRDIERLGLNFTRLPEDGLFDQSSLAASSKTKPNSGLTLQEAYDDYRRRSETGKSHEKTRAKYDYIWRLLSEIHGSDFPVRSYGRAEARKFQDVVMALPANWSKKPILRGMSAPAAAQKATELGLDPCHPNTARGNLSRLSTFFSFLEKEDIVEKNIARSLLPRSSSEGERRSRLPFTVEELQRIFEPHFSQIAQERGRAANAKQITGLPTDARFWAPLIALFTGMRISEICQLTEGEVCQIDGVWCIGVTWFLEDEIENAEETVTERSLKTEAAERFIPIAEELIRIGLLDLVNGSAGGSSRRIFGHLKPTRQGYLAEPISRWFARHLDYHGITSKRKVFHSFRHTFRDALRNAKVDRDVVLRIGGWSSGETSDKYGTGSHAKLAQAEMSRIEYPGLDLSHLYLKR